MTTLNEYNQAANYLRSMGVEVFFREAPVNPHMEGSEEKFNFYLTFTKKKESFSLHFSQSCRKPFIMGKMSVSDYVKQERQLQIQNQRPNLWGVLNCICMDADCLDYDFEEWAENLGYNPDSKKAEKGYNLCVEQTKNAQKILDLDEIREYLRENELD